MVAHQECSPEMPFSSLVVEESPRTARILGCLRSRELGSESQVIWGDLGKSPSSSGLGGAAPALHVDKEMLSLALWDSISCNTAAALHVPPVQLPPVTHSTPSPPNPFPSGGLTRRKPSHDMHHDPDTQPLPSHPQCSKPDPGYCSTRDPPKTKPSGQEVSAGRTIWISTAELYISTGLELKHTNGKKKPPTSGLLPKQCGSVTPKSP